MHQFLLLAATLLAISACGGGGTGATAPQTPPDDAGVTPPVVVSARVVCRLIADNVSARVASITGADGTQSVVAGGRTYWFFGDTVRTGAGGRADVVPAAMATSTDNDARDCVDLEFKTSNGIVEPMFPRADETTAWPDGVLALDDGTVLFYMVKAYRQSPFAWHVGSVGLGRIAPGSTTGVRITEKIWDENSGFGSRVTGARSPLLDGDDVIVFLHTDGGANYAARAPLASIEQAGAYTYWSGSSWTADPSSARPLWTDEPSALPADNGVQVTFDEASGKWLALYNGHLSTLKARTADAPWGPWSESVTWLDCRPIVEDVYPYCYSAELHPELALDDGAQYVTISGQRPYDVTLIELRFGVAVHEWRADDGAPRYALAAPTAGYTDAGVAFYASAQALDDMSPVYEREIAGALTYTLGEPPAGAVPAFYAYAQPSDGAVHLKPVHRWRRDGVEALSTHELDGWERGSIAFYVPCTRAVSENSDCGR
jgi:hypothetical protein